MHVGVGSGEHRTSILLVYPHVAHYRRAVLRLLEADRRLSLTVAAAETSVEPGIDLVPLSHFQDSRVLHHAIVGPFVWQHGVLRLALRSKHEVVIYMGAAHYLSTWLAAAISRARGKRVHLWTIGWHGPDRGPKRLIRLAFYRIAHSLLLYGTWGRDYGAAAGYPDCRMRVVGNSVSEATSEVDIAAGRQKQPSETYTFGAVLRLTPVKEMHRLIEAASDLMQRGTRVSVLIAGDGPEKPRLTRLARERGVTATFMGAIYTASELKSFYEQVDATVVPGAIGLTAIQSLAHGVPVVTHDERSSQMPEAEAIRHQVTGVLFDKNSAYGLTDALESVVRMSNEQRVEMAQNCLAEVQSRWTPESSAARIVEAVLPKRQRR